MEHVQTLDRPFPWRAAALVAGVLAFAELAGLLALAGVRLFPVHRAASATHATSTPAAVQTPKTSVTHQQPLRARSRVSVLVLNGNGIAHAAGNEATALLRRGYRKTDAADAPSQGYARSLVLFRPGWEREAQRLAHDAGIRAVAPLDGRLVPTERSFQLVLILGSN